MKNAKTFISILLASILIITQASVVFAAPIMDTSAIIAGTVTAVTLETDTNTGVTTVLVELDYTQTVRIGEEDAYHLGLLDYKSDGDPIIVDPLPGYIEIKAKAVISDEEEPRHPVGSALALFFSDIEGLDYSAIMDAHAAGNGFGVIAQALWMIRKLGGTADDFALLLEAKRDGDFSKFPLEDGTIPTTWVQLKKAVAENLGTVMSDRTNKENNGNHGSGNNGNANGNQDKGKGQDKDKSNSGNDNGNANGHKP